MFFNIHALELAAPNNPEKFIALLGYHYKGVSSYKKKGYRSINLAGNSFLLNPAPIFNSNDSLTHKVQYIRLAARRDYTLYKYYNIASLDLSYFPDVDTAKLISNNIVKVVDNKVEFKYENQYLNRKIQNGIKVY